MGQPETWASPMFPVTLTLGNKYYMGKVKMHEEKYRPFIIGSLVGLFLWSSTGGFLHVFVFCLDWSQMKNVNIFLIFNFHSICSLMGVGLILGLTVELLKYYGAVLKSRTAILIWPAFGGGAIGGLQGILVEAQTWGFGSGLVLSSIDTRFFSGAVIGIIVTYPIILWGIKLRQKGEPF